MAVLASRAVLARREVPLRGRVALVTGVSRRVGIAYAVVGRLATLGADVLAHSWARHDEEQPWGADPLGAAGVVDNLRSELPTGSGQVHHLSLDLADPQGAAAAVDATVAAFGRLDVLVAAHARSSAQGLADMTVTELDASWAVNVRSVLLLVQRFAEVRPAGDHPEGRVVLFTSGQHHGAMPGELPYVLSKGAVQQVTATLAAELAPRRATVNCVDPGPVDTGYADEENRRKVADLMPLGRWGRPEDVANLVEWLVSDGGGWTTGQTLTCDGGWSTRP